MTAHRQSIQLFSKTKKSLFSRATLKTPLLRSTLDMLLCLLGDRLSNSQAKDALSMWLPVALYRRRRPRQLARMRKAACACRLFHSAIPLCHHTHCYCDRRPAHGVAHVRLSDRSLGPQHGSHALPGSPRSSHGGARGASPSPGAGCAGPATATQLPLGQGLAAPARRPGMEGR